MRSAHVPFRACTCRAVRPATCRFEKLKSVISMHVRTERRCGDGRRKAACRAARTCATPRGAALAAQSTPSGAL
eukprot:scaffold54935_cov32-Tisochrysis_lutea.AAC.6